MHGPDPQADAVTGERFAAELTDAEARLRAAGLSGRNAFAALCRSLASRLGLERRFWIEGPDAPAEVGLDRIALTAELDLFGLAYERFFSDIFKAERGQFFTPRPLVELMVDLAAIRPGQKVLDPTCGSGSFLVAAHARGAEVDGIEIDPELVALCRLNLVLHGADPRGVRRGDLFRELEDDERWDVVLANPPFSLDVTDTAALRLFTLAIGRARASSDVLFLEAAWRRLRPGGILVAVLPRSLLANQAFADLRDWVEERFVRRAILSLPEGIFRPFGGAASRASVVALAKRPAALQPWIAVEVRHPGFDTRRKVYRPTEPDELARLRLDIRQGTAPRRAADERGWIPEAFDRDAGIASGVRRVPLASLAPRVSSTQRPGDDPGAPFTEIDLADVDKATGEVIAARATAGARLRGTKSSFAEGDLVFARLRPNLNNVAIVRRPDPRLPAAIVGSSEWVRLAPPIHPRFALVAARSSFTRAQVSSTEGQTRPRIRPSDLDEVEVPDPGETARAEIDRIVGRALDARWEARQILVRVAELYEAFGKGELTEDALLQALRDLDRPPVG
jgi:SAM-dependent methyltransferase